MSNNPFVGSWTYRSLKNEENEEEEFDKLECRKATIVIEEADFQSLKGTIGGDGWSLNLHGSRTYGSPMQASFQGKGIVKGEEWIYEYIAWLVPDWPNSDATLQRPAMVGSVVRAMPHSPLKEEKEEKEEKEDVGNCKDGVCQAGFVASFYAVRQD